MDLLQATVAFGLWHEADRAKHQSYRDVRSSWSPEPRGPIGARKPLDDLVVVVFECEDAKVLVLSILVRLNEQEERLSQAKDPDDIVCLRRFGFAQCLKHGVDFLQ